MWMSLMGRLSVLLCVAGISLCISSPTAPTEPDASGEAAGEGSDESSDEVIEHPLIDRNPRELHSSLAHP